MGIRHDLAAELAAVLPATWHVQPYPSTPRTIDPDLAALVMLHRTDVKPAELTGDWRHDVELWLVSPVTATDDGQAEDALDALLDVALEAIDRLDWLEWSTAERSTLAGVWPAWRIQTTAPTTTVPDPAPGPDPDPAP